MMAPPRRVALGRLMVLVAVLGMWECLPRVGVINPLFIPPLSRVLTTLWHLLRYESLAEHAQISLLRALGGLGVGVTLGSLIGFALGSESLRIRRAAEPLLGLASQANPVVLFHVVVLFWGIGEVAKIVVIAWLTTWPTAFGAMSGLQVVDPELTRVGRAFGLSAWRLFWRLGLPSAMPALFAGIRLAAGYAFVMLVAAEMMGTSSGLGWFVVQSQENYDASRIFAAATLIGGLAFGTDAILRRLEHICVYWQPIASANGDRSPYSGPVRLALVLPPAPLPPSEIRGARLVHHIWAFWGGLWMCLALAGCHDPGEGCASAAVPDAHRGAEASALGDDVGDVQIRVTADERGFTPSVIGVRKGSHTQLIFRRTTNATCANAVVFRELGIERSLPLNQDVAIVLPTGESRRLTFTCGMGMYRSEIRIE